jgi:transcriptional regulator with XRE-family HTH domain
MLVCAQIKMARAALGWSISELTSEASVSISTVKRVETPKGFAKATAANLKLIKQTLEQAGIEFIGSAEQGPGVRLWKQP